MKSVKFLLMMMLLAASVCALASCDVLANLPFDIPFLSKDTTTSEVTTVPTTSLLTLAPGATSAPVTTGAPAATTTTTTANPIVQKTPADIPCFTFDGVLSGYTIGYESGAEAAAEALATTISLPSGAYDATTEQSIRLAIVPDGDVALDAGGYHIYMSGKTIHILGGDAAGVLAGANAFAATVTDGKTSHSQYLHTVYLGTAPTGTFSLTATELIGKTTDHSITAYQAGDEITFVLTLKTPKGTEYVRTAGHTFKYFLSADDCAMTVEGELSAAHGVFAITVPIEMTLIPGSVRLEVNVYDENNKLLPSVYDDSGTGAKYTYIGGCYVDAEKITSDVLKPDDFESFWQDVLTNNRASNPTANVTRPGKDTYRNGFAIYKMDKDYLAALGYTENTNYDYYEIYLRSDTDAKNGRPAVGYVTVPKNASAKSLPIIVGLNSYDVSDGRLSVNSRAIMVKMHPNGIPMGYYDAATKTFDFAKSSKYFTEDSGFGKIVSDYDDPANAYLAKMLVRNIQMLHFLTDEKYDGNYPSSAYTNLTDADKIAYEKMRDAYNGTIKFSGDGSMGGFQHIATAGLCNVQVENEYLVKGTVTSTAAHCPWMCDPVAVAGLTGRLMGQGTRLGEGDNTGDINELNIVNYSYFDTAHFGSLISDTCTVEVTGGFADTTCPSSGLMALYNAVKGQKSIEMVQNKDHSKYYPVTQLKEGTSYTPAN